MSTKMDTQDMTREQLIECCRTILFSLAPQDRELVFEGFHHCGELLPCSCDNDE